MSSSAHAGKENTEPDGTNVGLVTTITLVGASLIFAIALALTALVRSESTSRGMEVGTFADLGTVQRLKAEQRAKLDAPLAWADKAKGQVALPIGRAMEIVTADIRKDPNLATASAPPPPAAPAPLPETSAQAPVPPIAAPPPTEKK